MNATGDAVVSSEMTSMVDVLEVILGLPAESNTVGQELGLMPPCNRFQDLPQKHKLIAERKCAPPFN